MLFFDAETRRQLEFDKVWSRIQPVSSLGKARHRRAQAFLPEQSDDLKEELDRLEKISDQLQENPRSADELVHLLSMLRDISGTLHRSLQGFILDDMEFYEVKKLLAITKKVQRNLETHNWAFLLPDDLAVDKSCMEALSIGQGNRDSFYLADAYDEQLANARAERASLESKLSSYRSSVNYKLMQLVGRSLTMDDCLSVSTADSEVIEKLSELRELRIARETPDYIKFCLAEEKSIQQIKLKLASISVEEENQKQKVRRWLTDIVRLHAPRLLRILEILGFLDLLLAKAQFCAEIRGVKPKLCTDSQLKIADGRHLLLEEDLLHQNRPYTPLSIELGSGVTMICGPNMGGKTTTLKTIGLLIAMAQFGLLVPAMSMEFHPLKFIAAQLTSAEIPKGLSAFAGEIAFFRGVVGASKHYGLILVDEIAHGTNPQEGAIIAQAIIEKQQKQPAITVITTHYPSLTRLQGINHLRVRGLDKDLLQKNRCLLDGDENTLHRFMDYRLEVATPKQNPTSDALIVAEVLGLDREIIARAKEIQGSDDIYG